MKKTKGRIPGENLRLVKIPTPAERKERFFSIQTVATLALVAFDSAAGKLLTRINNEYRRG